MSDTTTAVATPTPGVSEPSMALGPASGTTPVAALETAAPADFSPEPAAVAPETITTTEAPAATESAEAKPSILSEATGENPEAPAEEPKAKVEVKPAEPVVIPTPVYEPFKIPDGITVDDAKVSGFSGLLGEFESKIAADPTQAHAAAQEFGQKMLEFGIAQIQEAQQRQVQANAQNWDRTQEGWQTDFRNDPEIGKNRAETSLTRMGGLMDLYGQSAGPERLQGLRGILTMTGAGNNLEVLRFVNWAASRLVETSRVVAAPVARAPASGSRANRLYRNSIPNGAA